MSKYIVWSSQSELQDDGSYVAREVIEVTRTDKKVAEEDAGIIRDILHRKSWVQEGT